MPAAVEAATATPGPPVHRLPRCPTGNQTGAYFNFGVQYANALDRHGVAAEDVHLLAPSAALIVRDDLHPALVTLLAEAAQDVHGRPGLFNEARQFPSIADPELDMSPDAERLYKQGPGFLRRLLPFWLATSIERMIILLVPIATVTIPLVKLAPALYRWQVRRRILERYGQIKDLEARIAERPRGAGFSDLEQELGRIEQAFEIMPVPLGFAEQFSDPKGNIDFVRGRIAARGGPVTAAAEATG